MGGGGLFIPSTKSSDACLTQEHTRGFKNVITRERLHSKGCYSNGCYINVSAHSPISSGVMRTVVSGSGAKIVQVRGGTVGGAKLATLAFLKGA